jgi:hypothetical protein
LFHNEMLGATRLLRRASAAGPSALGSRRVAAAAIAAATTFSLLCEPAKAEAEGGAGAGSRIVGAAEVGDELKSALQERRAAGVSLKEVRAGDGQHVAEGMWVVVHYVVRLVGDGTVLDDTRRSGCGDRDYGEPFGFELGDLRDLTVLRALHPCVLDMRVGGVRRVRTTLLEPSFGYRRMPVHLEERHDRLVERTLGGDWLVDIEVSLVDASPVRPPTGLAALVESAKAVWADRGRDLGWRRGGAGAGGAG